MELLEQHFETAFAVPDGIKKLRELILTLAMQGKLVPQAPNDPPASELLKEIEAERMRLAKSSKIKTAVDVTPIEDDETPLPIPHGWKWVRLGQVCSYIQRGKGPKYVDNSPCRVISQKCVRWWGLDLEPARCIDPESLKLYEPIRFLLNGDLLWNSTGTGTIGRACLVPHGSDGEKLVTDSHVTVVRPLLVNSSFLWRWIQSPAVQDQIENLASGTTNQIELNTSTIVNHLVPLAPLPEQHRIVAKIDELMARCDALEKLRADRDARRIAVHTAAVRQLLNVADATEHMSAREFLGQHFCELYSVKENVTELRKAILQLAVMGRLVPQDPNDPPASELLKKIEAEKKRLVGEGKIKEPKPIPPIALKDVPYDIPPSWRWVRMGELCNGITSGSTPSKEHFHEEDGIPFLKVYNIRNQMIDFAFKKQFVSRDYHRTKMARSKLTPGDVVMNIVGPPLGKTAIIPDEYPEYNCNQAIVVFRPIVRATNKYLYIYLLAGTFLDGIELVGTAGQDNISVTKSQMMPIPFPPIEEQNRIAECVSLLMQQCDTLEQQIDARNEARSAMLNAMMAQFGGQRCA